MKTAQSHTKTCTCTCVGNSKELAKPYLYCIDCFYRLLDELKPAGACSSQRYNGKKDYQLLAHLDRVEYMSFGVHNWIYNKALNGCEESLFKLNYGYRLFDEVQNKAKEEGLIPSN